MKNKMGFEYDPEDGHIVLIFNGLVKAIRVDRQDLGRVRENLDGWIEPMLGVIAATIREAFK